MSVSIATDLLTGPPASQDSGPPALRIAAQADSAQLKDIAAAGHVAVPLPVLDDHHFNRPMNRRLADGEIYRLFFESESIDLLYDIETAAMTFVPDPNGTENSVTMTHSLFGMPYVVHFIDPITETMQQVDWPVRWQLLEHPGWIKWVWDEAHARELQRLGVTNVLSMPMAVGGFNYPTEPLPHRPTGSPVLFLGHPATSWFKGDAVRPADMRIGLMAAAAKADDPALCFHEFYFDLYRIAEPPNAGMDPAARAQAAATYFQTKFTYNVFLAVKQRDRFVHFLQRNLGDQFDLVGDFWSDCHGMTHKPSLRGRRALTDAYRNAGICVNLFKGNAETGLNLRQFEVTAAGGFLLTYDMPELSRYFDVGKECVVFRNEKELLDRIRYYLAHPDERIEIALAGQRRALSEHLYSHRFTSLVERLSLSPRAAGNGSRAAGNR